MSIQVVNLGLPKSGTTTLARALREAGYEVADHRFGRKALPHPTLRMAFVAERIYQGYFETGDPMARLIGVEAISEMSMLRGDSSLWPQMDFALILAIKTHHPNVKFLASRRDAFAMSKSMLAWSNLGTTRLPMAQIPGLPAGYGQTTKERMQWIDGHYTALAAFFAGRDDFLEFEISDPDAPHRIGAFLGRDLPWWGKLNANPILTTDSDPARSQDSAQASSQASSQEGVS
ncbi:sulfotransferase family protein [Rhodobacteraceae bacterium M382]|nr:sulfotransferase family protein [Rhodobacteraceae bacterium M382]